MPRRSPDRAASLSLGWRTLAVVAGGLLLAYYAVPLAYLAVAQSPTAVVRRLADPAVVGAVWTSLSTAAATTAVSLALGVPLAYWLATTEVRGKSLVTGVLVLPLVLPPVVSGILLVAIVGPAGLGGLTGVGITRTWVGVVLAQTFVASPFVVVTAMATFEGVDRRLVEAAQTLGAGPVASARRVWIPLAWPGILAGATLTFARAMGEFGATMILAYYPTTMPVAIWRSFVGRGLAEAVPVAILLLVVSVVALAAVRALGVSGWGAGRRP